MRKKDREAIIETLSGIIEEEFANITLPHVEEAVQREIGARFARGEVKASFRAEIARAAQSLEAERRKLFTIGRRTFEVRVRPKNKGKSGKRNLSYEELVAERGDDPFEI